MRRMLATMIVVISTASLLVAAGSPVAAQTPAGAVAAATSNATSKGVTSFISVVDRSSGRVLSRTGNAGAQVASESIMKLFLATYYLWSYGGYTNTPQSVKDRLSYMLRYSDDGTASALFTASAIPTVAATYGLGSTANAADRVGHWGAARITANDMTRFLYRASKDPGIGPWLIPTMAQTARTGSGEDAGFSQYFGLNALSGVHGSKQGWGCDSYWTSPQCAVHSVGYTDRYFVAVLQLGGYPDPMRSTATTSARLIQRSVLPLRDGEFICDSARGYVYRIAGGAPIYVSTWSVFGGSQPCRSMSPSSIGGLRTFPADGTFVRDRLSGRVYRIAGGAPIYVAGWASFGGPQRAVDIDPAAIDRASRVGPWNHLRRLPADGTFLRGASNGAVYRVAGGAPIYVSSWAAFGGARSVVTVDSVAIDRAGAGARWNHLRRYPSDGTYLRGTSTGAVFRVAGGAPLYVTSWALLGGEHPAVNIDYRATSRAGSGGGYNHLRATPADRTFLRGLPGGRIYRVVRGVASYVPSWAPYGGPRPFTSITQPTIDRAGSGGDYNHLVRAR